MIAIDDSYHVPHKGSLQCSVLCSACKTVIEVYIVVNYFN